ETWFSSSVGRPGASQVELTTYHIFNTAVMFRALHLYVNSVGMRSGNTGGTSMIFGRIIAVAAFTTALTTTTALVSAQEYQQSPVFDAAVAAGTLPPVAERLPDS